MRLGQVLVNSDCILMKIPVEPLARLEAERHKESCQDVQQHRLLYSKDMLYLGPLDEIDVNDKGETPIWVENGKVYLNVPCPSYTALQHYLSTRLFFAMGGICYVTKHRSFPLQNGEAKFWRKPTAAFVVSQGMDRARRYPVVVLEMASNHESLHRLFCKASVWLNEHTDVVYCMVVKVDVREGKEPVARLYILERTESPASSLVKMDPKTVIKEPIFITEDLVDRLRRTKPSCPPDIPFDPESIKTDEGIGLKYRLNVNHSEVFSVEHRSGEIKFKMDAKDIYENSIFKEQLDRMKQQNGL